MSPYLKILPSLTLTVLLSLPLVARINLPQHNESALLQRIIIPDRPADSHLWDFSKTETVGDPVEVRFDRCSDSCISATLPGIRYDFAVCGDTLYRLAVETHYTRCSDTIPLLYALPSVPAPQSRPFASRGRAYHSEYIDAFGDMKLEFVSRGTLILPEGDTLRNVSLTRLSVRQYIAAAFHALPVASHDNIDSLMWREEIILSWLSPDYPVPLLRHSVTTDSLPGRQPVVRTSSWMCPPSDQPLRVAAKRFNTGLGTGMPSSLPDGDSPLHALAVDVSSDGITVSGIAVAGGNISMLLTDVIGRVFSSMPPRVCHSGTQVEWSVDKLPAGQYILYINRDDSPPFSQKLIIRQ